MKRKLFKVAILAAVAYVVYRVTPGHDHTHPYKCRHCEYKTGNWMDYLAHTEKVHDTYSNGTPRPMQ